MRQPQPPTAQGLYSPQHEHDSCGVGFIVQLKGQKSHRVIEDGITALEHLAHRGACGCEANTGGGAGAPDEDAFERKLYVIRKRYEHALKRFGIPEAESFYFPSLSCRTLVYKGMLMAVQLREYFPDLSNKRMISALCMFHSRFSTNTFPSWRLAHPYRMISHNGEINTLRGNINWMRARESLFESPLFDDPSTPADAGLRAGIQKVIPVIDETGSDTACFDNALELLTMAGRPVHQAVMMMIPEPWDGHESMSQEKKDFYEYHSCLMEPWDGPAMIVSTNGRSICALLDRNGLRPFRYTITKDDKLVMASEAGVLDIPPMQVEEKGRL